MSVLMSYVIIVCFGSRCMSLGMCANGHISSIYNSQPPNVQIRTVRHVGLSVLGMLGSVPLGM